MFSTHPCSLTDTFCSCCWAKTCMHGGHSCHCQQSIFRKHLPRTTTLRKKNDLDPQYCIIGNLEQVISKLEETRLWRAEMDVEEHQCCMPLFAPRFSSYIHMTHLPIGKEKGPSHSDLSTHVIYYFWPSGQCGAIYSLPPSDQEHNLISTKMRTSRPQQVGAG